MTNSGTKATVLAVASAVVVVVSVYLGYKRRLSSNPAARVGQPSMTSPGAKTEPERVVGGGSRPRVGELGKRIHGVVGDLARGQRRLRGEGEQVMARFRLGQGGRALSEVDLSSAAPRQSEPTWGMGHPPTPGAEG